MKNALNIDYLKVYGVSPVQEAFLRGREVFIKNYCAKKGWDIAELSFEQIIEIRQQRGWKCPEYL